MVEGCSRAAIVVAPGRGVAAQVTIDPQAETAILTTDGGAQPLPLGLTAGLRRGELQALRVRDIDLQSNLIAVERGWDQVEGVIEPKSRAGRRSVPLLGMLAGFGLELAGRAAARLAGTLGIVVHSSTQHPTEVQHICARLLGCDFNQVTTVVRRLGGGFGGKSGGRPGAYLQAALHAEEQPGVAAIHELAKLLNKAEAEGRLLRDITLVPYANPIGLHQAVDGRVMGRFHLGSGVNFNRAFPLPPVNSGKQAEPPATPPAPAAHDRARARRHRRAAAVPAPGTPGAGRPARGRGRR